MGNLFAELKRRHIYRVAAAYAVVAWVLLQLFNNLQPIMKLPDWAGTLVLVLLVGGFPITLLIAWTVELKSSTAGGEAAAQSPTTKLDYVLAGALIAVIALVSYQQLARPPGVPAATATGSISIAVLPFANMSGDVSQEFFSDGMTEEITTALAQISGLRVLGRTSAFEFKGQNKDLRTIGRALGATHLIEGSIRKAGNRVRVTAQLVKADDDSHLWAQNYDREITDIFAIQEDIAQAIAGALKVPLGLKQGDKLVRDRISDPESYQQYLRARALYRARSVDEAIAILEPLVARDPDFAPGWALLTRSYMLAANDSRARRSGPLEDARRVVQAFQTKAEAAAQNAIRADAGYAGAYSALARIEGARNHWIAADDFNRKALALDPNDPDMLSGYGGVLFVVGRNKELLRTAQLVQTLEPFVPANKVVLVLTMQRDGQNAAAIPILESLPSGGALGVQRYTGLARSYAALGRYREAADALLSIPQDQNQVSRQSVEDAARLLRSAPAKVSAPETLPAFGPELTFVYAYVGALDRVFEAAERNLDLDLAASGQLWYPYVAPLRKTERFKAYVRKAGFVDYWRARGWPDHCRPMGADDFVCD